MLPALNAGSKAFCESMEGENGGPISEPIGGSPELGKICSYYEHNDGMGILNVTSTNVPLSELDKTKTELEEFSQKSPKACEVTSDIKPLLCKTILAYIKCLAFSNTISYI